MAALSQDDIKSMSIFHPWALTRINRLMKPKNNLKLSYYTSAKVALDIIKEKKVWMRNAKCMNDFREVEHGIDNILKFLRTNSNRKAFMKVMENCFSGSAKEVDNLFTGWQDDIRWNTYITCLSEHRCKKDVFGRLSMWRAYSHGSTGIAFILNPTEFPFDPGPLNIYLTPVAYFEDQRFAKEFRAVIKRVNSERSYIKQQGRELLINGMFNALVYGTIASKHPGFEEEAEWRVVHFHKMHNTAHLEKNVEVVNETPQTVYKIPLGKAGGILDFEKLLNKIIIGPCAFPVNVREAFIAALGDAGIKDPESRVVASEIPLR
jgi:hypothetical protein